MNDKMVQASFLVCEALILFPRLIRRLAVHMNREKIEEIVTDNILGRNAIIYQMRFVIELVDLSFSLSFPFIPCEP
jgi:hypothetical protein